MSSRAEKCRKARPRIHPQGGPERGPCVSATGPHATHTCTRRFSKGFPVTCVRGRCGWGPPRIGRYGTDTRKKVADTLRLKWQGICSRRNQTTPIAADRASSHNLVSRNYVSITLEVGNETTAGRSNHECRDIGGKAGTRNESKDASFRSKSGNAGDLGVRRRFLSGWHRGRRAFEGEGPRLPGPVVL